MLAHMKMNVEHVLMGATGVVVLAAWLLSGVSFETGMKDWRDGDLIVQESKSVPVLPAFAVKDSAPVHMGIVQVTQDGPVVIEAREKVVETPLAEFVARGRARAYAVYRVASLGSHQAEQVITTARAQLGKAGDFFLDETQDNLYSSELVRLSFGTAGVTLGSTERLRNLAKQNPLVQARFMGRWSESKPCKRRYLDHEQCWGLVGSYEVIPPQAIVADARVSQVFLAKGTGETLIAGNASQSEVEPKLETPAVGLRP
jgi:hypothetical protein